MVLDLSTELVFGAEPDELSLLYFLSYMQAAGGWVALTEFEGGAQQDHFVGGSQQICLRLADELGDAVVLEAPVERVAQDDERGRGPNAGGLLRGGAARDRRRARHRRPHRLLAAASAGRATRSHSACSWART